MRRLILIVLIAAVLALALFWFSGGFDLLSARAAEAQKEFQNGMARALRALKAGQPGAVAALLSVCFGYGFFHAAGPGHGKIVIGGYGLAKPVAARRLIGLAVASSLAQGLSAIALVSVGVGLLGLSRANMTDAAEQWFAPFSYGAILLVGLWLFWRGIRHLRQHSTAADHPHDGDGVCPSCGHSHGPTPQQAAQADTPRDWALLVGAIAMRPCTGAIFLLILTWRFGIFGLGVLGTLAMAMGTATITAGAAMLAFGLRGSALWSVASQGRGRFVAPALEITAGLLVAFLATSLLMQALQ